MATLSQAQLKNLINYNEEDSTRKDQTKETMDPTTLTKMAMEEPQPLLRRRGLDSEGKKYTRINRLQVNSELQRGRSQTPSGESPVVVPVEHSPLALASSPTHHTAEAYATMRHDAVSQKNKNHAIKGTTTKKNVKRK